MIQRLRSRDAVRTRAAGSLAEFVKMAWHVLEPETPLKWGWAVETICDHLEAVTDGRLTRLLINVPPGMMKSLLVGVFWPAWEWGPRGLAHLKVLSTSYKEDHARRDARKMRELLQSSWYREHWGDRVEIKRGGDGDYETSLMGWRKARPIGSLTGDRGDRLLVDDPHSTEGAESDASRLRTNRIVRESLATRLNDPKRSAIIVIMQRLHEDDVSGMLLREELGFEHLCLPMRFEWDQCCFTSIGFEDPRLDEGDLLFPERWDAATLDRLEKQMGPYAVAGQHQQRPAPRDGELFKRGWFEIVDTLPHAVRTVRAWDLAATPAVGGNSPDYTVGLKGYRASGGDFIVTDMIRLQGDPRQVMLALTTTAQSDGYRVEVRLPQDPGAAGKLQAEAMRQALQNRMVRVEPVQGDKMSRALGPALIASQSKIKLARGAWNDVFLDELCSFPRGRHDDIVDAFSDLIQELSGPCYDLSHVTGNTGRPVIF